MNRYKPVRKDLVRLLNDRGAAAVTTMMDFYGLPEDFPGVGSLSRGSCYARVRYLEDALKADFNNPRFRPYLSLHEFEALVLVSPLEIQGALPDEVSLQQLVREVPTFSSPEEIDDGPATHPAARILKMAPTYKKKLHGPIVVERIGLQALRQACPHFNEWVTWLESLG